MAKLNEKNETENPRGKKERKTSDIKPVTNSYTT